nr:MAG TPA: hypothetical protein [Caudoviricetes sp.]
MYQHGTISPKSFENFWAFGFWRSEDIKDT